MRMLLLDFSGGLDLWALSSALVALAKASGHATEGAKLTSVRTKWGFRARRIRASPKFGETEGLWRLLDRQGADGRSFREALREAGLEELEPKAAAFVKHLLEAHEALRRPRVLLAPVPVPVGSPGAGRAFLGSALVGLPARGDPSASPPDPVAIAVLKAIGASPALPSRGVEGVVEAAAVGAGARGAVCKALLLRPLERATSGDVVAVIEATVDDMPPEFVPPAVEALLEAGALDAFVRQVSGKKGRPALEFVAICPPEKAPSVEAAMLERTTTIGLRRTFALRATLEREERTVQTPLGPVRVKVSLLPDGSIRTKPEFEDCLEISRKRGVPLPEVWAEAMRAAKSAERG